MWSILAGALLIFFMRVCDVTLGTFRQIMAVQGRAYLAAFTGFFELTIFILAISKTILSINESPAYVVAYAGGFAVGTLTGVKLEGIIGLGTRLVRVITTFENLALVNKLREAGYGVTVVPGEGMHGPVFVLISVIKRPSVPEFVKIVKELAPKAFYTVEETRFSAGGILGPRKG